MKRAALAALFVALPAGAADLFSRLDANGDGYLTGAEMQAQPAPGAGWIAIDRDGDERYSRHEFQAVVSAPPVARDSPRAAASPLQGGYSARRLIGAPARDFHGTPVGVVRDLLLDPNGAVTALVVEDRRVPWLQASVDPGAQRVTVPQAFDTPQPSASAGATRELPAPRSNEWLASELLDDVVQLERGVRFANVEDLIIAPSGAVRAVVVDAGPGGMPGSHYYDWSRGRAPDRDLRPFDYRALGILPPRASSGRGRGNSRGALPGTGP